MRFAKKYVFAVTVVSLLMGTTTFCCPPFSLPSMSLSSETARIIDTTYENLMRFSKALDVPHEELTACGISPDKVRIINLESILKAILPGQPAYVNYYLRMSHFEALFSGALDKFLHSDKTWVAATEQVFYPGNYDFEKTKSSTSESKSAKSYMDYVHDTFLTAYRQSQRYRERLVTFLAVLEWRRKSDPEFEVRFTKGNRVEERLDEHILSLCLELSNGEHYKPKGYSCTLPIPCEDAYPNKLTLIRDAIDDIFVCMHELGHGVHDLLDIHMSSQIPFAWMAENPFIKNLFFSF